MPAAAYAGPDWDPIIECESGGDPNAENPTSTASGILQITDPTWADYGGIELTGVDHASDASLGDQMTVAARIYADRGLQPWKASRDCWADAGVSVSLTSPVAAADSLVDVQAPTDARAAGQDLDRTHTVVTGDTLSELALTYRTTVDQLDDANDLDDPDVIRVGAVLRV